MKKIIAVISMALLILIAAISYDFVSLDKNDDKALIEGIQTYFDEDGEIEIIKTVQDSGDYFLLYKSGDDLGLCILEKKFISLNRYYKIVGGKSPVQFGAYNLAVGNGQGYDHLLVALGYTKALESASYKVIFNGQEEIVSIPRDQEFFLRTYRKSTTIGGSWARIQF